MNLRTLAGLLLNMKDFALSVALKTTTLFLKISLSIKTLRDYHANS